VDKKKRSFILAMIFLVQSVISSSVLSFESSPLNLFTNGAVNNSDPVLREVAIAGPAAIFQVSPALNEVLSSCKIEPLRACSSSEVNHSL
jgi:hypothetical protein